MSATTLSKNALQRMGELSHDGFFIYDIANATFNYVNDPFAEIFGVDKVKLSENPELMLPLIRSEDTFYLQERYKDLLANHYVSNDEFRVHKPDGTMKHLCMDAYVIDNSSIIA